ncbi:hypothetical protein MKQ68_18850 [Chitinophaga horti]|uniref:Metal-dependent phosphohydrolase 7TM extracellular domain-containing protein n=1 Tax=Chitinophaga horti TaxID=2920382 RepID=A0ABY6IXN2_9BACT|nr:hypothetical protein [Chitinophaga horti]UYQ92150.1 hypothetical protein MKQ68_18850 [Chitinophaga horti]
MMKRGRKSNVGDAGSWMSKAIGGYVSGVQRFTMEKLQRAFERLSPGKRKLCIAMFFLVLGGWSLMLVIRPGYLSSGREQIRKVFRTSPVISVQENYTPISAETFSRIRSMRLYLDRLEGTEAGRKKLDSIVKARPGLRDSLLMVEKLYDGIFPD